MKKALLILLVLSACKQGKMKVNETMSDTNEPTVIVQTCLDSLNKVLSIKNLAAKFTEVELEKSHYLSDHPNLKWANSKLKYEGIPDSLKKPIWKLDPRKIYPYILKLDTLSYDYSNGYVKILCITQRTQFQYRLKHSGNRWQINEVSAVDYEEGPGPNIVK